MENTNNNKSIGKKLEGVVTSNKMQNTIVVKVTSKKQHPKYKKFIIRSQKFKVHVEDDTKKPEIGETVLIFEHKPISKDKNWILTKSAE